jgi:hypothetical protein
MSPRPRIGLIVFAARIEVTATKELKAGTRAMRASLSLMGKRHNTAAMRQTKRTSHLK